ncbi:hypothetical protein [uncultured Mediterranean phage uvMED]|nr:hypothetical protein [uncultured Mediterranean phage uvMED]
MVIDDKIRIKQLENENARYKKAYYILMDYFDYLDDDLKEQLDRRLDAEVDL